MAKSITLPLRYLPLQGFLKLRPRKGGISFTSRSINFHAGSEDQEDSMCEKKFVKVAIIGPPNVGKSTLFNKLIQHDISCVSNKVHTTRTNLLGVYTNNNCQIKFYDSPGIVSRQQSLKHYIEDSLTESPSLAVDKVDIIAAVVDSSNWMNEKAIHQGTLDILNSNMDKQSVLILNKIDLIREKRKLLDLSVILTSHDQGFLNFERVFSISARHDDGVSQLRDYLMSQAKPVDKWEFGPDFVGYHKTFDLVKNIIRGKVMDYAKGATPYMVSYEYSECRFDEWGSLQVRVKILTPKQWQVVDLIGKKGIVIHKIVDESRDAIARLVQCDVRLNIEVEAEVSHQQNNRHLRRNDKKHTI